MSATTNKKWNKFDVAWVLNLFGTAVGAGVLFLPINARSEEHTSELQSH